MSLNVPCNGRLIRHHRERRGWTQTELAVHADLSERLVRKAEAGGPIRSASLERIAAAVATKESPLQAVDLSGDPLSVAQAFMRSYHRHGAECARHCAHILAPDVVMVIHATADGLAFSGEFHGIDGIGTMIRNAHAQFRMVEPDFGTWTFDGTRATVFRKDVMQARDRPDAEPLVSWLLSEYRFRDGLIARVDSWLDSLAWARYLEQHPKHDAPASPVGHV